jgi:lipopolysaccharide export system protein LptC
MIYWVIGGGRIAARVPWSRMADIAASIATAARRQPARAHESTRRAKAFAAASRHSALVRFLRVVILGGAVGTVVVLFAIALFDPFGRLAGHLSLGNLGVDGTKVTMAHLKLSGFRKDGHPYLVNAREAIQDATHPTLVELHALDADLSLPDGGIAHMVADSGLYDTQKEHMDVKDNVRVKSPQYEVWLKSAALDFNGGGGFASKEAVKIVTSNGTTMAGDSISSAENGKALIIEGHVKTAIPPADAAEDTQAEMKGAAP